MSITDTPTSPLSYYGPRPPVTCPLCHKRPTTKKKIYEHEVCKKCFYAFANRRQLGYLVDAVLITIPNLLINFALIAALRHFPVGQVGSDVILFAVGILLTCLFVMKDGFHGQSPGKYLSNVQVLDDRTGQPISFGQSFKRNSILLLGAIPFVGGFAALIVLIVIAMQVAKGYRWGDRFAGTRAIWKKYATLPVFGGNALVCESCGYDLQGNVSGICPECGTAISERNAGLLAACAPK